MTKEILLKLHPYEIVTQKTPLRAQHFLHMVSCSDTTNELNGSLTHNPSL